MGFWLLLSVVIESKSIDATYFDISRRRKISAIAWRTLSGKLQQKLAAFADICNNNTMNETLSVKEEELLQAARQGDLMIVQVGEILGHDLNADRSSMEIVAFSCKGGTWYCIRGHAVKNNTISFTTRAGLLCVGKLLKQELHYYSSTNLYPNSCPSCYEMNSMTKVPWADKIFITLICVILFMGLSLAYSKAHCCFLRYSCACAGSK